jgi:hypothetical protein
MPAFKLGDLVTPIENVVSSELQMGVVFKVTYINSTYVQITDAQGKYSGKWFAKRFKLATPKKVLNLPAWF